MTLPALGSGGPALATIGEIMTRKPHFAGIRPRIADARHAATRVLVVDDDPASVDALRTLLELDGFDVTAIDSSRLAVELLDARPFDVVVTDLEMPGVSGLEVIRRARAVRPETSVFVVTGCADPSVTFAALAHGACRVFDKPLDYAALAHAMSTAPRSSEERRPIRNARRARLQQTHH
jgi:DNA-binding NtrC family response regulator